MKQASNLGSILSVFVIVAFGFAPATSQARKPRPTPAPISASGAFSDCSVVTDTRPISTNSLLTVSVTENLTGTFNGSFIGTEYEFVHPEGSAVFYGSGVFTGTVGGKTGS